MADARRWLAVALAAVSATGLLSGCGASGGLSAGHEMTGTLLDPPFAVAGDALVDGNKAPYSLVEDTDKDLTLVFFGYTHCPDICNVVLANVASALRDADAGVREGVELLFVTTDPARDTGPVVRDYLDRFDPSYVGLVAPEATVKAAARALHIAYEGATPTGGGYEVSHGTQVTAFTDGSSRVVWPAETSVAGLRADLTRLVEG